MLILGPEAKARPFIRLAEYLGWQIALNDGALPNSISADAVLIISNDEEYVRDCLTVLKNADTRYIGIVTEPDKLPALPYIDKTTFNDYLFCPAGLSLGGERPEDIALSVIAHIQLVIYAPPSENLVIEPVIDDSADAEEGDRLAAIILAAGGSTRFGGLKQLLEYEGVSLLRKSVETAQTLSSTNVYVILGPKPLKMQRELSNIDVATIVNPNWEEGMATSIKAGMNAVPNDCSAALIMLCDQPLITSSHLQQLYQQSQENPDKIIASAYADTVGVPAIIPRRYFPEVRKKLYGDRGIKPFITAQIENVITVSIPEAECDIDTQEDYTNLLTKR